MARPKFRHDHLMAEPLEDGGSKYIDVLDPDTGSMFRFHEIEFAIACGMDGQRDVAALISWAREELGLLPTAVEVRNVIARLGELGYLDVGALAREAAAAASAEPVSRPVEKRPEPAAPQKPAARRDDDLAPGIVVGAKSIDALPPAADVELGSAGAKERSSAITKEPPVEDFALGAPGVAFAPEVPKLPVEDVALGAPGRNAAVPQQTDVSLDLSEQVGVGLDDVKEAVRASRVMSAVEVPKELLDAIAEPPVKPEPVVAKKPEPVAKKPEPVVAKPEPVVAKPVVAKPEPVVAKPVEKPAEKPAIVAKQPPKPEKPAEKHPVAPAPGSSNVTRLIVLFVLLLAAFGVYMVWKHVIQKSNSDATKTGTTETPVTPKPEPKPEPKKPDPIKLAKSSAEARSFKADAANTTVEQVTTEKSVKKDQVVIWLKGGKAAQVPVELARIALEKAAKEVADLKAQPASPELDKKIADAEKRLVPKKEALDKAKEALDKVSIKAAADGEVTLNAKAGKVAEGDVLFSLTPVPTLLATFPVTKPDVKPDSLVYIAVKGSESKLTCKATKVDDKSTVVECPFDATSENAEVELVGLAPDPIPQPKPIEQPKPVEPKPVEQPKPAQPVQPRPVQPRPVQPKPADPKPAEPKPADPKPADPPATPPAPPAEPPAANP